MQLFTVRHYMLSSVVSALQKAIRRGDAKMAMYWACEMWQSGYDGYLWRRLLVISAEDCLGGVTSEVMALRDAYLVLNDYKQGNKSGLQFPVKAAYLLSRAMKSRDNDNFIVLLYRQGIGITDAEIEAEIEANKDATMTDFPIPWEAYDCHTPKGKRAGHTKNTFVVRENRALSPKQPGLFDHLVDHVEARLTPQERRIVEHEANAPAIEPQAELPGT